ncbi:MAG: hypothetical protein AAFZ89_16330, partial [Bacteroidota bacterium]
MAKKLPPLFLFILFSYFLQAQYIENTPWMEELHKKKGTTSKSQKEVFSLDEMRAAFDAYWEGKDYKARESGFKQFKRWENYWSYLVDSQGYLPGSQQLWEAHQNKINNAAVANPV